jgi:hypothetical protein
MSIPGRKLFLGEKIYTDWFQRGGDNIIVRADKVASSGTTTATIKVFTKNTEDTGDGNAVEDGSGSALSFTVTSASTDVEELIIQSAATSDDSHPKGLLELVRLEIEVTSTGSDPSDYVQVRLFPPIFFNAAT